MTTNDVTDKFSDNNRKARHTGTRPHHHLQKGTDIPHCFHGRRSSGRAVGSADREGFG